MRVGYNNIRGLGTTQVCSSGQNRKKKHDILNVYVRVSLCKHAAVDLVPSISLDIFCSAASTIASAVVVLGIYFSLPFLYLFMFHCFLCRHVDANSERLVEPIMWIICLHV